MDKFDACPFCQGESAALERAGADHFVACDACGARGPRAAAPDDAAEAWNAWRLGGTTRSRSLAPDKPADESSPGPIPLVGGEIENPDKG